MKIFVESQYMENYGDSADPCWKCKGEFVVFCRAENGRSDVYYQNLADKMIELAEWDNTATSAYGATVQILEDDKEFYLETMYRKHAEGEYGQGAGIYKPDRIVIEDQLLNGVQ